MIPIAVVLLALSALLLAQNNETSVEVNDMERVKKDEDMTSPSPQERKEAKETEQKKLAEVKNELDRAVQNLNSTQPPSTLAVAPVSLLNPQQCTALDCNNRGTCLGSRTSFFCACQFGFSGRFCEDTVCNSARDCNGRGLCLGTSSSVTCLCSLGYGGPRCETAF